MGAFEEYVNKDGDEPIYDQVPLENAVVTVKYGFDQNENDRCNE